MNTSTDSFTTRGESPARVTQGSPPPIEGPLAPGAEVADVHYERLMRVNNELANLQRELARSNAELSRLGEEKSRFLGMAAHDLRSPLAVILNYSDFLLEEAANGLAPEQREFITVIKETSAFMLRLVEDLLDLSVIESGQLRLERTTVELGALVAANIRLNQVLAAPRRITLQFERPDQPVEVVADADKLQQVLNNLIGNAIKFSPSDALVTIELTRRSGRAIIAVQDAGPGMEEPQLARLFKPFSSTGRAGRAGERNTGLGLAICARIIEGHGGRIWAASAVGQGSTFRCELPEVRPADDCGGTTANSSPLSP